MTLRWFYGTMAAGKSTLALQVDHNYRDAGMAGLLLTCMDRSGQPKISSRLGLWQPATEVTPALDLYEHLCRLTENTKLDYVIADEAQFYTREQIDQLAAVADDFDIEVSAYGIATDFRGVLFPGSARLFEIADERLALPATARCWCGRVGQFNARLDHGVMVMHGDQVAVGDTNDTGDTASAVSYVILCRRHHRARQPGPDVVSTAH